VKSTIKSLTSSRFLLEIALIGGLMLAIGIPRWLALNRFVTTDEVLWLDRSGKFYYALAHHDFAATFQKSHPGVTVMWAGLVGYMEVFPKYSENPADENRPIGLGTLSKRDPDLLIRILAAGRQTLVLFSVLVLGLAFWFARQLFDPLPAFIGFLLIAFDPFHIALSRVLHLDGLLTDLMLLSLLAFLVYLRDRSRTALVISALSTGLAWLTKSPGLFLIPFFVLLLLFDQIYQVNNWRNLNWRKFFTQAGSVLVVWGIIAAVVFVALWPSMWVNPISSVTRVLSDAIGYAEAGHDSAVFFNGQIYQNGEVPDSNFYLINFLWRTTPPILLGLLSLVVLLIWKRSFFQIDSKTQNQNRIQRIDRQTWDIIFLLFFALSFGAFMTLGLKKFDRYILPSIAPLDLVAGVGLAQLIKQIGNSLSEKWRPVLMWTTLITLTGIQAFLAWTTFPYYFSYYNPLLGGAKAAQNAMQIGWGEGLDQAARYLNNKPNSDKLKVMAWYANGSFSYISKSKVSALDVDHSWSADDWTRFYKSDYIVVYIHEWQRNLPTAEVLDSLRNLQPEYSVWINGLEYVRVYKTPQN
jgi:dolichyl-phosphate-mannose-protein mannosyltransferase